MSTVFAFDYTTFSYTKENDTFATEASALTNAAAGEDVDPLGGPFCICGRTGECRLFELSWTEFSNDEDLELVAWHYVNLEHGHHAVVFND